MAQKSAANGHIRFSCYLTTLIIENIEGKQVYPMEVITKEEERSVQTYVRNKYASENIMYTRAHFSTSPSFCLPGYT